MKKIFASIFALALTATVSAQTVNIHFNNGQTLRFHSSNVSHVDFSEKAPDPTLSAGEVVDLGLSVYWSSVNIGAEAPEESGNFYAWGETEQKISYTRENYAHYDASTDTYNNIGSNISGTEFDAATVNIGPDWRMPTQAELKELLDNCTWEWSQINGVNGFVVTGPNGNNIFLPAAGYKIGSTLYNANEKAGVAYFSATEYSQQEAYYLRCYSSDDIPSAGQYTYLDKYYGTIIRPVTSNPNATGAVVDHSQDHLVTDYIYARFEPEKSSYSETNGIITYPSTLAFSIGNGSNENIKVLYLSLIDGVDGSENKYTFTGGEFDLEPNYMNTTTLTVPLEGVHSPRVRYGYRYNNKEYTVEASMSDTSWTNQAAGSRSAVFAPQKVRKSAAVPLQPKVAEKN